MYCPKGNIIAVSAGYSVRTTVESREQKLPQWLAITQSGVDDGI